MDKPSIYEWYICVNTDNQRIVVNTINSNVCAYEDPHKAKQAAQEIANQTGMTIDVMKADLVHHNHLLAAQERIQELERLNFRMQHLMALGKTNEDFEEGTKKEDQNESESGD